MDLDRRRAPRQNTKPRILCVPHEIDSNVDLMISDQICNILISLILSVNKVLKRGFQSVSEGRIFCRSKRYPCYLKTRFVMMFKQTSRKICNRMIAEIGGEISYANAIMRINFAAPESRK